MPSIATVTGDGVFGRLKFESGVHRVQRVPTTEAGGRIHTSAATVAVLPEVEDIEIDIAPTADGKIAVDGTRASKQPSLWLVGYGEWTGAASATIVGVTRAARDMVARIQQAAAQA